MNQELQQKFYDRWPEWFRGKDEGMQHNLLCFGFEHGDGWFNLEWKLCEALEVLGVGPEYKLFQIKEKFGTLRWYDNGASEAVHVLVHEAEKESAKTCEECGQPGTMRQGGWWHTYCDTCEAKRNG